MKAKVESVTTKAWKQQAGERAALLVEDGMIVGLGSGTTALAFVRALGVRVESGLRIHAVSSSEATTHAALAAGIELIDFDARVDLAIDGADAIERGSLSAIKGLGGALTREKLVALAADQFVLVGDTSKVFGQLSESQPHIPIPVEALPFGWQLTRRRLSSLGDPVLRLFDEQPFVTDNGNLILDLYSADFRRVPDLAAGIKSITGVVEHGLFLNLASLAIIAGEDGLEEMVVSAG